MSYYVRRRGHTRVWNRKKEHERWLAEPETSSRLKAYLTAWAPWIYEPWTHRPLGHSNPFPGLHHTLVTLRDKGHERVPHRPLQPHSSLKPPPPSPSFVRPVNRPGPCVSPYAYRGSFLHAALLSRTRVPLQMKSILWVLGYSRMGVSVVLTDKAYHERETFRKTYLQEHKESLKRLSQCDRTLKRTARQHIKDHLTHLLTQPFPPTPPLSSSQDRREKDSFRASGMSSTYPHESQPLFKGVTHHFPARTSPLHPPIPSTSKIQWRTFELKTQWRTSESKIQWRTFELKTQWKTSESKIQWNTFELKAQWGSCMYRSVMDLNPVESSILKSPVELSAQKLPHDVMRVGKGGFRMSRLCLGSMYRGYAYQGICSVGLTLYHCLLGYDRWHVSYISDQGIGMGDSYRGRMFADQHKMKQGMDVGENRDEKTPAWVDWIPRWVSPRALFSNLYEQPYLITSSSSSFTDPYSKEKKAPRFPSTSYFRQVSKGFSFSSLYWPSEAWIQTWMQDLSGGLKKGVWWVYVNHRENQTPARLRRHVRGSSIPYHKYRAWIRYYQLPEAQHGPYHTHPLPCSFTLPLETVSALQGPQNVSLEPFHRQKRVVSALPPFVWMSPSLQASRRYLNALFSEAFQPFLSRPQDHRVHTQKGKGEAETSLYFETLVDRFKTQYHFMPSPSSLSYPSLSHVSERCWGAYVKSEERGVSSLMLPQSLMSHAWEGWRVGLSRVGIRTPENQGLPPFPSRPNSLGGETSSSFYDLSAYVFQGFPRPKQFQKETVSLSLEHTLKEEGGFPPPPLLWKEKVAQRLGDAWMWERRWDQHVMHSVWGFEHRVAPLLERHAAFVREQALGAARSPYRSPWGHTRAAVTAPLLSRSSFFNEREKKESITGDVH